MAAASGYNDIKSYLSNAQSETQQTVSQVAPKWGRVHFSSSHPVLNGESYYASAPKLCKGDKFLACPVRCSSTSYNRR